MRGYCACAANRALARTDDAHRRVPQAMFERASVTPDDGVHALYVVSGCVDFNRNASNCNITQDDFAANLARNNLITRIPTPTDGEGLVEAVPATTLTANLAANGKRTAWASWATAIEAPTPARPAALAGRRKTHPRSCLRARPERGISADLFATERDGTAGCATATSAYSACTMAARTIWRARSSCTRAAATRRTGQRRRTSWLRSTRA